MWKEEWNDADKGFVHPRWDRVVEWVGGRYAEPERDRVWTELAREWIGLLNREIRGGQASFESAHFLLSAAVDERKAAEVLRFLERVYRQIVDGMPFPIEAEGVYGKFVVVIFADLNAFYKYLSDYVVEEREMGMVGGVFLNQGYGHFAMPSSDLSSYSDVLSHELSHAMVMHLRLPTWVDEAIAMAVEHAVTQMNPYYLDREIVRRHQDYWDRERIEAFWRGDSFWFPDEGQELSYHLARFLFSAVCSSGGISGEDLGWFVEEAAYEDAGAGAFRELFGFEIGEVLCGLLGEGDWSPGDLRPGQLGEQSPA